MGKFHGKISFETALNVCKLTVFLHQVLSIQFLGMLPVPSLEAT